jgi:hypothetical protein
MAVGIHTVTFWVPVPWSVADGNQMNPWNVLPPPSQTVPPKREHPTRMHRVTAQCTTEQ